MELTLCQLLCQRTTDATHELLNRRYTRQVQWRSQECELGEASPPLPPPSPPPFNGGPGV